MKSVNLMIFDLDGTLVTSGNDLICSVNHMLASLELPTLERTVILQYIGDGIKKLIKRSLGHVSEDRFCEAMDVFLRHYEDHMLDTTVLYPDVTEVLIHFRDKTKVILTNKRHRFATAIADALHISSDFDDILGADSTPYIKPDRRIIDPLLARFDAAPDQTVVIGDGVNDILVAKNAGLISCAFLNGLTDRETLLSLNPDYSFERMSEIKAFFR